MIVHYVQNARDIAAMYKTGLLSEREIAKIVNLSKSETHRMIAMGNLPEAWLKTAEKYGVEKYVLVTLGELKLNELSTEHPILTAFFMGDIRYYHQVKHLKPKRASKPTLRSMAIQEEIKKCEV